MKIHKMILTTLGLLSLYNVAGATTPPLSDLDQVRMEVVREYIADLERADAERMSELFSEGAIAVSTSRGEVDAKSFFNAFLPMIETAETQVKQVFINPIDENRLAARFHLAYTLIDGEEGEGEYMDEFVFLENSSYLSRVYMFENLKFSPHEQGD